MRPSDLRSYSVSTLSVKRPCLLCEPEISTPMLSSAPKRWPTVALKRSLAPLPSWYLPTPMEAFRVRSSRSSALLVRMLMLPAMASPSMSGVMALVTSRAEITSEGMVSSSTPRVVESGLASGTPSMVTVVYSLGAPRTVT